MKTKKLKMSWKKSSVNHWYCEVHHADIYNMFYIYKDGPYYMLTSLGPHEPIAMHSRFKAIKRVARAWATAGFF